MVSVIIVAYRVPEHVRRCLASLYAQAGDSDIEVIVVDNAPGDGTAEIVRAEFPGVRLFTPKGNIGFARACNLAAEAANGSHLLLLNPDTVVRSRLIDAFTSFAAANPDGGLYGGRTLAPSGEVDPRSCWGVPSLWSVTCYGLGLTKLFTRSSLFDPESLGRWERDDVREVGVVTGCLLFAPVDVWNRLGGFDTRFFMYGEDADLSIRAWKLGYRPTIVPDAEVTHDLGASTRVKTDRTVMVLRSKVTLFRKHWSRAAASFGVAMLRVGVSGRAMAEQLRSIRAIGATSDQPWSEVWRRQSDWTGGYPEVPAEAMT